MLILPQHLPRDTIWSLDKDRTAKYWCITRDIVLTGFHTDLDKYLSETTCITYKAD